MIQRIWLPAIAAQSGLISAMCQDSPGLSSSWTRMQTKIEPQITAKDVQSGSGIAIQGEHVFARTSTAPYRKYPRASSISAVFLLGELVGSKSRKVQTRIPEKD